jgi:hypothetical protein
MTDTILVGPNPVATQVVSQGDGETLVINNGPSNVFFGDRNGIRSTDGAGIVLITPNSYFAVTGELDLYACVATGTTSNLSVISGGLNFFLPVTSLTIPYGATGQRIVINPPAFPGSIVGYNNSNLIEFIISPSGYLIYDATGGALNHLFIAIQNAAGTDSFTNPFAKGIQIGPQTGPQVLLAGGNPAFISWPLNDSSFPFDAQISGQINNPGPTRYGQVVFSSARLSTAGHGDWNAVVLNSPAADGSSSANAQLDYIDATGAAHIFATWDDLGFGITTCKQLTCSDPSITGTPSSPAVAETWHDMRPLSNSFVGTIASRYPPQYRKLADGNIQISGFIQCPNAANPNSITFATLPAAYRPTANTGQKWSVVAETNVTPVGTICVQIDTSGALQVHNAPTTGMNNNIIDISGIYPLDNTGVIAS